MCVCVCVFSPWALTSSYAERVLLSSVLGTMPPLHASSSSPADSHIYVHLLGARGGIWWLRSLPPSSFRPNFFLFCFVLPTMEKDCSRTTPLQLFTNDGEQSGAGSQIRSWTRLVDHDVRYIYILLLWRCFYPKRLAPIHSHIHTPTAESTTQGDSQLVRRIQGEVVSHRDNPTLG